MPWLTTPSAARLPALPALRMRMRRRRHQVTLLLATLGLFPLLTSSFVPLSAAGARRTRIEPRRRTSLKNGVWLASWPGLQKPVRIPVRLNQKRSTTNDKGDVVINPLYLCLATAETIFWYRLAPGIDPSSRWFAPEDASLISDQLLNPSVVLQGGSGIEFSSLLLNSFLILPSVWSLLLLQEDDSCAPGQPPQTVPPLPFCLAGFLVGGGALIPYMIVRKARRKVDSSRFPKPLKWFEGHIGPPAFVGLLVIILATFSWPFLVGTCYWNQEWAAFSDRLHSSQFTSLALFDSVMISTTILDPMMDDAKRRGVISEETSKMEAAIQLAPYLVPLVGPVAWIYNRPKYKCAKST